MWGFLTFPLMAIDILNKLLLVKLVHLTRNVHRKDRFLDITLAGVPVLGAPSIVTEFAFLRGFSSRVKYKCQTMFKWFVA